MQQFDKAINRKDESIIDEIRQKRNLLIKQLLVDSQLKEFLEKEHCLVDISAVKLQFIKRSLQELLIAPVDLEHYGRIILHLRKPEGTTTPILHSYSNLFYEEIGKQIKSYLT